MMIYSKTCEYAIRSLAYFSLKPSHTFISVREISKATHVPYAYAAKICQCLVASRILKSHRGPGGGFLLLADPKKLTLLAVIKALDDISESPFTNCIMGLHDCDDKNPCPLHFTWAKAKETMLEKLRTCTVSEVAGLTTEYKKSHRRHKILSQKMRNVFSG